MLLTSPERLASARFAESVLPNLLERLGMLVIDEAHCVSDWGFDFRPDYQRLTRLLTHTRPDLPVLATTATANDRVTRDVADQLRPEAGAAVLRWRPWYCAARWLDRRCSSASSPGFRLCSGTHGWPPHSTGSTGSGIVYVLTVADTVRLADFLTSRGHRGRGLLRPARD